MPRARAKGIGESVPTEQMRVLFKAKEVIDSRRDVPSRPLPNLISCAREYLLWLTTKRRVRSGVDFPPDCKDSMMKRVVLAVIGLMLISPVRGIEPEHHLNSVSVFLGVASEGRRQRAGSVGLEYERRLGETWFIAPALEHAFGDLDFSIVTLSVGYRFTWPRDCWSGCCKYN